MRERRLLEIVCDLEVLQGEITRAGGLDKSAQAMGVGKAITIIKMAISDGHNKRIEMIKKRLLNRARTAEYEADLYS